MDYKSAIAVRKKSGKCYAEFGLKIRYGSPVTMLVKSCPAHKHGFDWHGVISCRAEWQASTV